MRLRRLASIATPVEVAAFGILIAASAQAQSLAAPTPKPTFDAASVKPAGPFVPGPMATGIRGGPGTNDPGRITSTYVMLKVVLMKAYDLRLDQISGPAWMDDYSLGDSNRFAITATMPPDTTPERFRLMLQNLLAERLHLAVHHETREFPGYELVVAPGGPKLRDAAPEDAGARRPVARFDAKGFPLRWPGDSSFTSQPRPGTWGMIRSSNRITMARFAESLGRMVNESNGEDNSVVPRVVDRTGLTGTYEFTFGFAGINKSSPSLEADYLAAHPLPADAVVAAEPGEIGPTIFAALEKQLGLKLQKVRNLPVEMLIVDHVDRVPAEN